MLILDKRVQEEIFTSDKFYIKTLEDILDCLAHQENYEKAAEVRDLIIYEKLKDPIQRAIFKEHLIDKYKVNG